MSYTPEQITQVLDEYFASRTEREYVGMRYVPVFGRRGEDSIEWDGGVGTYEPLTIVTHDGDSYTSRQYVPVGVDISNGDYWAETGNYDAQVEEYLLETRSKAFAFDKVSNMTDSDLLYVGAICHTNGFHAAGDGGAAWYEISDSLPEGMESASEMDVLTCAGDLYAVLQVTGAYVTPEMFGAVGDGVTDDSEKLNYLFSRNTDEIFILKNKYLVTETILTYGVNINCTGEIIAGNNIDVIFSYGKLNTGTGLTSLIRNKNVVININGNNLASNGFCFDRCYKCNFNISVKNVLSVGIGIATFDFTNTLGLCAENNTHAKIENANTGLKTFHGDEIITMLNTLNCEIGLDAVGSHTIQNIHSWVSREYQTDTITVLARSNSNLLIMSLISDTMRYGLYLYGNCRIRIVDYNYIWNTDLINYHNSYQNVFSESRPSVHIQNYICAISNYKLFEENLYSRNCIIDYFYTQPYISDIRFLPKGITIQITGNIESQLPDGITPSSFYGVISVLPSTYALLKVFLLYGYSTKKVWYAIQAVDQTSNDLTWYELT